MRFRETSDKIQSNVGPRASRDGEWMEQARWRPGGGLIPSAGGTRSDKRTNVPFQGGPPETETQAGKRTSNARVTKEEGTVSPVENLMAHGRRDEGATHRAGPRIRIAGLGLQDPVLNVPREGTHKTTPGKDGLGCGDKNFVVGGEHPGKGISLNIL